MRKLWQDRRLLFRTLTFLKPWLKWHALGLFLTILAAGLALVQPWVTRLLIDKVLIDGNTDLLLKICFAYLGAVLLGSLVGMAMSILFSWVGQSAAIDLKMALYKKLNTLSMAFTGRKRVGELMAGFTSDIPVMQSLYSSTLSSTISEVIRFFVVLAVMISINPRLTLLAVPSIPLFAIIIALAGTMLKKASAEVQEKRAFFTATLQEQLSGLRTSAAFNLENRESVKFKNSMTDLMHSSIRLTVKGFVMNAGSLLASTTLILVIWLGGKEVIQGRMDVGVLIAFISYFGMLFGPVGSIAGIATQILKAMGAAERVFTVIDTEPAVTELPGAAELTGVKGKVEFKNISFSYSEESPVLKNFNEVIHAGETVALSGDSGSGKTTLISLLLRFFDPDSGEILIDGNSTKNFTLESLRRNIGVVFQDPFLYHCSVAQNILLGSPEASMDEIEKAARAAHAHEFITTLPDGYDTLVGERGSSLSGGQVQRLALARVFLKDPPIVVLDEATSALDSKSESKIQDAVSHLLQSRTCLVIAHRQSTVESADRVVSVPLLSGNNDITPLAAK
ncbi:MAG: ABC transporter ATP-binding protein [Candidatus Sabulitectum sp.]|nr:ABC transporter ATP-binding protein [Candidatus Sabulitectum sp.]